MDCKIVLAILLVVVGAGPARARSCVTSRGIAGECVARNECDPLIEITSRNSFKMLSQGKRAEILSSWRCGSSTLVCCPNETPYSEPPPSVERHRNLGLLPGIRDCGSTSADRLFGGNETEPLDFPWMALISTQTTGPAQVVEFTCGGTVINSRYILTAAHCITNLRNLELVGVRVGEWDISSENDCYEPPSTYCNPPVQDLAIEEVIPHPGYVGLVAGKNHDLRNDIGLLRLAEPIDLTVDNVLPICLPTTKNMREVKLVNETLKVTGWGKSNIGEDGEVYTTQRFSNPRLLQINVPIVTNRVCAEKYNNSGTGGIGFRHLCAGGQVGISSCDGDSGGPLAYRMNLPRRQVRFVQFGVVSAGNEVCGLEGQPSIFTNVAYYMDWILDTIRP